MISYGNDWTIFFTRPVSGVVMAIALITLVYPLIQHLRRQRRSHTP
jgi:putative tricarboxylic transport membrane protein